MSERNPARFKEASPKASERSLEEQHRLMAEEEARAQAEFEAAEQARYEAFQGAQETEYNESLAAREQAEYDHNAQIEARLMSDLDTRRMYMMAQQVAEMRASGAEPEIIADKENKLQELVEAYNEKAHADHDKAALAASLERSTPKGDRIREEAEAKADQELARRMEDLDFIINSTDAAWVSEKLGKTKENAPDEDIDKGRVKDEEEARALADVEALVRAVRADPEAAEKAGIYDKIREVMSEIDAAIASAKASAKGLKAPETGDLPVDKKDDELKAPETGDLPPIDGAEVKKPETGDLPEISDELKAPETGDLPVDKKDDELKAPETGDLPPIDGDTKEIDKVDGDDKKLKWYNAPFARLGAIVTVHGGDFMERFRSRDKKAVAAVVGAVAVVGGLIAWRMGVFGHGGGGDTSALTPGQKGGHPGGTGIETPPPVVPKGPEVPSGDNYAHPWNWMTAAMDNGSINPPKGMTAEEALHFYGEKAAAAGHKVEWHNLANGFESITIDGSDSTEDVAKILTPFAK